MKNQNERNHPPKPAAEDDAADAAELAKLTKEFTAALTRLLPAAERAAKRGKHSLLRLISRKLPRLKTPPEKEPEDEELTVIWDVPRPDRTEGPDADQLRERIETEAKYGDSSQLRILIASMQALDPTYQPPPFRPAQDTAQIPAKTQAIPKVSKEQRSEPVTTHSEPRTQPRTSGAPRSANEEPWPGQTNFPRPKRGPMPRR